MESPLPSQAAPPAPSLVAPRRRLPLPRAACWALALLALAALLASDIWWMEQARALRTAADAHFGARSGRSLRQILQIPARGWLTAILFVLLLAFDRRRARAFLLVAVALAVGLTGFVCKDLFGRERPAVGFNHTHAFRIVFSGPTHGLHNARYQSFPSGHAAGAGAHAVALSAFYPAWAPVFWGIALVSGAERVYHEKHFPSDVLAGFLLAQGLGGSLVRSPRLIALCERLAARLRPMSRLD